MVGDLTTSLEHSQGKINSCTQARERCVVRVDLRLPRTERRGRREKQLIRREEARDYKATETKPTFYSTLHHLPVSSIGSAISLGNHHVYKIDAAKLHMDSWKLEISHTSFIPFN